MRGSLPCGMQSPVWDHVCILLVWVCMGSSVTKQAGELTVTDWRPGAPAEQLPLHFAALRQARLSCTRGSAWPITTSQSSQIPHMRNQLHADSSAQSDVASEVLCLCFPYYLIEPMPKITPTITPANGCSVYQKPLFSQALSLG
ncbi:39S ribosomal protein L41, mitochondrial [Platysternon megacephalum]|uniref:39S ribosomal protein L41, mitochondrial n=1 Tax=Platysternon megacephalum TaxID=55544 RepID=A0A4D9DWM7_9SAUR|nr:39S ribosomal protein L41, mitochondrial [Platysternon megacephalum]